MTRSCDVCVVGAGAAGLMAAIEAARRGRRTVLLEKNDRPGLKILISGGGRCNLTTTKTGKALEREYGEQRGRFLRHALRAFQPKDLMALVEAEGVPLHEEDLDKIFPVSRRARDVLDAFLGLADRVGVEVIRAAPMASVTLDDGRFVVETPSGAVRCESVVLATGGLSYEKTGSTGDGYGVARQFGHALTKTVAHLAPLCVEEAWVRELAGIVLNDSLLGVAPRGGKVFYQRQRPILFTHKGLSGPAAMDLAGFVEERGGGCDVVFDFVPGVDTQQLESEWLASAQKEGRRTATNLLPARLPERLRRALVTLAGADGPIAEVPKAVRRRLLHLLRETRVPVQGSLGMAHAEVTRGGIPLDEVDARTMQSKLQPGLYLCGEILDVDGPIGGFNFQAAFATGRLAGLNS